MTSRLPRKRSTVRQAKSDYLGLVYCGLGPDRSLDRVFEMATQSGLKITRTTIAGYSRDDGWVAKARKFDEDRAAANEAVILERAIASDVDHAQFYQRVRSLAFDKLGALIGPDAQVEISPVEATRMGDIAIKGERLISGKATSNVAILTSTLRMLIDEIGPSTGRMMDAVEAAIREHVPEPQRALLLGILQDAKIEFARHFDSLVEAQYTVHGLTLEAGQAIDDE